MHVFRPAGRHSPFHCPLLDRPPTNSRFLASLHSFSSSRARTARFPRASPWPQRRVSSRAVRPNCFAPIASCTLVAHRSFSSCRPCLPRAVLLCPHPASSMCSHPVLPSSPCIVSCRILLLCPAPHRPHLCRFLRRARFRARCSSSAWVHCLPGVLVLYVVLCLCSPPCPLRS